MHKAATPATQRPGVDTFTNVAIDAIVPSPTNPRKHFDASYIAELASSIAERGLIQPIVVRELNTLKAVIKHPDAAARNGAHYEIVAGECRWRASKQAGLPSIPAIVRAYTDEQVLEAQLEENIHRTDLTPLEEAAGYRRLIDSNPTKHSAESIASRIGMSPAYVWDRLKLLDLVPEAKQLLEDERIGVGHAILIARQKPEDQQRIIKPPQSNTIYGAEWHSALWVHEQGGLEFDEHGKRQKKASPYDGYKPKSIRELERWITDNIRFDVQHAAKAQPLTFETTAAAVEEAAAQPGRGRKVVPITFDYRCPDGARDPSERTFGRDAWKRADGAEKSKTCDHAVLGTVVAGREYGQSFRVCVNKDKCRVHWAKEIAAREKNQKLRDSGKGKQAARREAKQAESWEARWKREKQERERQRKAFATVRPRVIELIGAALKDGTNALVVLDTFVELLPDLDKDEKALFARVLGGPVTAANAVRAMVLATMLDDARTFDELKRFAKPYGVNLSALEREYQAAAAPPKKPDKKPAAASAKAETPIGRTRGGRRIAGESNIAQLKADATAAKKPAPKKATKAKGKTR